MQLGERHAGPAVDPGRGASLSRQEAEDVAPERRAAQRRRPGAGGDGGPRFRGQRTGEETTGSAGCLGVRPGGPGASAFRLARVAASLPSAVLGGGGQPGVIHTPETGDTTRQDSVFLFQEPVVKHLLARHLGERKGLPLL